ncbi:DnaJ/Hsp40 cysteine-rich domain superfamily protein [Melia azedarach]|uniref:DnaJ/Hsp40 cysteine-rich domain superfamily protein n=1 Tax=Melia azedarach TaxID=155640 RepID=A0ACC1YEC3_MELAZ|nr:DnaJ/Hsp40 cysteine-rich domain superfamily protein [Melia azedarach]
MDCTLRMASSVVVPISSSYSPKLNHSSNNKISYGFQLSACNPTRRIFAVSPNGSVSPSACNGAESSAVGDVHRKSSLESLFCYDKSIPEERIEKPVGLSLAEKVIGDNPRCTECEAKGAVLCSTCSGSGLYVDSILESQGIIVKVRCLGCGGTGNIMCTECGGRGHR